MSLLSSSIREKIRVNVNSAPRYDKITKALRVLKVRLVNNDPSKLHPENFFS